MLVSLCLGGCATNPISTTPYPLAYKQALKKFSGSAETPASVIDEFVDFLSNSAQKTLPVGPRSCTPQHFTSVTHSC